MEPKTQSSQQRPPHVVVCLSPGMGHLIPLTEFAKRLVPHGLSFTFAVPSLGSPSSSQKSFLSVANASTSGAIDSVFLPPVDLSDLPGTAKMETLFCHLLVRSLPSLRELLTELTKKKRVVVLLVDLFATEVLDLAPEFNLRPYIFFPSTAMALSLFLWLHELDESVPQSCEFREMDEPVRIPGCVPVHGKDLLDPLQDRKDEVYKWMLHHTSRYRLADGIIENSFEAMECGAIKALLSESKPVVYPVGPIVQVEKTESESESAGLMKWLDEQPVGSVLFVNFGSGGTLSSEQQTELALGLEMSGQRFLWVVRKTNDLQANATYFSVDGQDDPLACLPEGFLDRTKGRGLAVPTWAPQMKVLNHSAIGGFLSHCGWNSTLESVVNGVPFICWPLYAEQKMNAVMLTEDLRVGLRPVAGEEGVYRRGEIARAVKGLMEGEEGKMIRNRMRELKAAAAVALSEDGSSTKALKEISLKWKSL